MSQEVGLVAEQAVPVTSRSGVSVRTDAAERSSSTAVSLGGDAAVFDFDILSPACPSRTVLRHVVDRWTPLVVTVLADGPSRFGELRARVGGVTPKVLTQTLRSMERDGLVTRTQLPGVPPRVDYELTDLGRSLQAPIDALRTWIEANSARILAHRESYDAVGS
nr:helix-turn-helix domain-containing protein [Actinomyces naeslundii]